MRHRKKGRKLGSDAAHQRAMLRTLAAQLFVHERVKTTEARAKELRILVDKLITLAKRGDVHARRQALQLLENRGLVHRLFSEFSERYQERNGGYSRIVKLGPRLGDAAPMVIIELV